MNKADKEKLRKNRVTLVSDLQPDWMYEYLIGAGIYEPHQTEEFESKSTKRLRNGALLNSIETRGPTAFAAFVSALRSSNQGHLAELLDSSGGHPPFSSSDQSSEKRSVITSPSGDVPMETESSIVPGQGNVWPNPEGPTNLTNVKVEPTVVSTEVDVDAVYTMQSKPRGLAYIINNKHFRSMKTRQGTDVDKRNLEHTFEQLGFNVDVHEDLRAGQMQQNLRTLAKLNHSTFNCLIVAILSHGIDGAIYGTDEHLVKTEDVIRYFDGQNCPTMAGKPKLFFLQACRGERFDSGVEATDSTDAAMHDPGTASLNQPDREEPVNNTAGGDNDSSLEDPEAEAQRLLTMELEATDSWRSQAQSKLPNQSDMLLAYATVPGYVSWRNSERGSWFVQALCETFLQYSGKEDLLSMITMINNKVAKAFESSTGRHKQMPAPVTMLRKKLFFYPGRYQDARQIAQPTS